MRIYDDYNREYYSDRIHVSKRHMMKYLTFAYKKPIRLLDVGCGTGYYLKDALNEGIDACGIDSSQAAVVHALVEVSGKIQLGSITEIPYEPEQFDVVTAIDVIEHINPPDTEKAVNELYRVLKPGGFLILTTPSGFYGDWVHDLTHINVRPPKYWHIIFTKYGFKVTMPYVPSFLKYFVHKKIPLPDSVAFRLEEPMRHLLGHYYVRKGRLYMLATK